MVREEIKKHIETLANYLNRPVKENVYDNEAWIKKSATFDSLDVIDSGMEIYHKDKGGDWDLWATDACLGHGKPLDILNSLYRLFLHDNYSRYDGYTKEFFLLTVFDLKGEVPEEKRKKLLLGIAERYKEDKYLPEIFKIQFEDYGSPYEKEILEILEKK